MCHGAGLVSACAYHLVSLRETNAVALKAWFLKSVCLPLKENYIVVL